MNGLRYHEQLRVQLMERGDYHPTYAGYLERVVGVPVQDALVSAGEHAAPFNSLSTVSFVLPQLLLNAMNPAQRRSICILAASLIPLDNTDYPRGFLLPGPDRKGQRLNLFPYRLRKASPVLLPGATVDCRAIDRLSEYSPRVANLLASSSTVDNYAEQLCRCMTELACQWFEHTHEQDVVIRPLEEVARQVLLQLLRDEDEYLSLLLFDPQVRTAVYEGLKHVFCAWGDKRGSFLFWSVKDCRVYPLGESGGRLNNDWCEIRLTPERVYRHLDERRIMPTVFLSLFAVSYLTGLPIAGGSYTFFYYAKMIAVLNQVLGLDRSGSLAKFAYNAVDLSSIAVSRHSSEPVHAFGTGLALAQASLEPSWMARALRGAPLLPMVDGGYFH